MQINVQRRPTYVESLDGSLKTSRMNSINNLTNSLLLPRSRTLSTYSLPQQLSANKWKTSHVFRNRPASRGHLKTVLSMHKWFESLKRKDTDILQEHINTGNIYSKGLCNGEFIIPEVIVSGEEDYHVQYNHSDVEDDLFCEDDVTIENAPIFDVAQVSVTPEYDIATQGLFQEYNSPVSCDEFTLIAETHQSDLVVHDDVCKMHRASENTQINAIAEASNLTVHKDTLAVKIPAAKGFIQSLLRKASSRKSVSKRHKAKTSTITVSSFQRNVRSKTMVDMNEHQLQNTTNRNSSSPMIKSNSEPLFDVEASSSRPKEKRQHTGLFGLFVRSSSKDKPQTKQGHSRKVSSEGVSDQMKRTKSVKAKKIRRCPSVEQLDSLPYDTIPQTYAERLEHEDKEGHTNTRTNHDGKKRSRHERKVKSYFDRSRLLSENQQGQAEVGTRPEPDITASSMYRSASDPCVTFNMMEEKVLVRSKTKKGRKRRPTECSNLEKPESPSSVTTDSSHVTFTIGDEDCGEENGSCLFLNEKKGTPNIETVSCDSNNSYYDNLSPIGPCHFVNAETGTNLNNSSAVF